MTRSLNPRERHLIIAGGLLLATSAFWIFLIAPAVASKAESFAAIRKADAIADLLATATNKPAPTAKRQPLPNLLTQRAKNVGLSIRRLDPSGATLSVTLDDAPYAAVVGWMAELTEKDRLRISSVEMGRRTAPGFISTRITLESPQ